MTLLSARSEESDLGGRAKPSTSQGVIRLGMPHLALTGLSESWLLKELGDRHWRLIAEAAGRENPSFQDVDGAPVYPAFSGLSIEAARFDQLGEHDDLVIASDLTRVSTTQFVSRHRLICRGIAVGLVSLASAFVKRHKAGSNHALARIAPQALPPLPVVRTDATISSLASKLRAGRWQEHFGFAAAGAEPKGSQTFTPCPSQDFNGAGFLYFPSFAAFVDRTEWALFGVTGAVTSARDVVYFANIDVGESLTVEVLGLQRRMGELRHWCRLSAGDGRRLADVFTQRTILPA